MEKQKQTKTSKIAATWASMINPLRYLTKGSISQMIDNARRGNDARLQIAYNDMEKTMPIYSIVIQRRIAGVLNRKWNVKPLYETEDSKNQAEDVLAILQRSDMRNLDGFSEAIRHLCLAAFRGRSIVKPFIVDTPDGIDISFMKVPNWKCLEWENTLYWSPDYETLFLPSLDKENLPDGITKIPENEVMWVKEERPVDLPGIEIYLRQLVGEETWARAIEKYGVAQIVIKAPEGTPDSALPMWSERALRLFEGGSGVLPPGAEVESLTDARGQDPFSKFIEHQTEMIVMLACGSTLGTLPNATGLGSGLAELQDSTFQSIVNYDCKKISNSINGCLIKKITKAIGYNKVLCKFEYIENETTTPLEYIEMAKAAKDLGLAIDAKALSNVTGLPFIKDELEKTAEKEADEWSVQLK